MGTIHDRNTVSSTSHVPGSKWSSSTSGVGETEKKEGKESARGTGSSLKSAEEKKRETVAQQSGTLPPLSQYVAVVHHLSQASDLPSLQQEKEVVQLLTRDGKPVRVSSHGVNAPFLGFVGEKQVVFKEITSRDGPEAREEAINEVVASRIMAFFGIPTVSYRHGAAVRDGKEVHGVVSDYEKNANLYENPDLERITNGDQAVAGSIVDAWMGDYDRVVNDGNIWVKEDGSVIFGDYGTTFRKGVECLGLPKANIRIMSRFARKENVEPVVQKITQMNDEEIRDLVSAAGRGVEGWDHEREERIASRLMENRDQLRARNPFAVYYESDGPGPVLKLSKEQFQTLSSQLVAGVSHPATLTSTDVRSLVEGVGKKVQSWDPDLEKPLAAAVKESLKGGGEDVTVDACFFYSLRQWIRRVASSEEALLFSLGMK